MKLPFRSLLSVTPASLTLGVIALVVALFAMGVPFLELTELKTYDLRFLSPRWSGASPTTARA